MKPDIVQTAAAQFGRGTFTISAIGNGLIHHTYKVDYTNGESIVLQCMNRTIFKEPKKNIENHLALQQHLHHNKEIALAPIVLTLSGSYFWEDGEHNFWRATKFIRQIVSPELPRNSEEAAATARYFASFTKNLINVTPESLHTIIPNFHNLAHRYQQFEEAINNATIDRLLKATHVISELRNRTGWVQFYRQLENNPRKPVCVVDLDTVMPGYFFSDLGDMIRSMACTQNEESTAWEEINVSTERFHAIVNAYREEMVQLLTDNEKDQLHLSGHIITYLQSLRFVTDFLNNDVYYKTNSSEHNLNRALNQLLLLEKLEELTESF
jgi:hypothetical protein